MNRKLLLGGCAVALVVIVGIAMLNIARTMSDIHTEKAAPVAMSPARSSHGPATFVTGADAGGGDIATLRAGVARNANDAGAWTKLGNAYLQGNSFQPAIDAYKHALAINPSLGGVWSTLGEAYIQTIKSSSVQIPPPAQAAFAKALAIDKNDLRAHFYLTMQKDFMGQHDEALAEWIAMLSVVPTGSQPDKAIRAAITASIRNNLVLIKRRLDDATKAQAAVPRSPAG